MLIKHLWSGIWLIAPHTILSIKQTAARWFPVRLTSDCNIESSKFAPTPRLNGGYSYPKFRIWTTAAVQYDERCVKILKRWWIATIDFSSRLQIRKFRRLNLHIYHLGFSPAHAGRYARGGGQKITPHTGSTISCPSRDEITHITARSCVVAYYTVLYKMLSAVLGACPNHRRSRESLVFEDEWEFLTLDCAA